MPTAEPSENPRLDPSDRSVPNRAMVLAVASLGGFLVTFMSSSINIALPLIDEEFHVSAVILSWISLAYILVSSATLLPTGRLADLHGRVRLFTLSMLIFSVMSFASAFAPSVEVLLVFRAIHGVGLAIGAGTSTALIVLAYPPEIRGRALGLSVATVYLGMTLGPVLGGLISYHLGWRGLFIVVGAASALNVALPLWKLRGIEWKEPAAGRFDVLGSVISGAALIAIMLGFSLLPGATGAVLLAAGVAGLGLFLWWETKADEPLISVALFRHNRVFTFANMANFINYGATGAMLFLMSIYLQYNRGLNTQTAGLVLVSGAFFQALFSPMAGRLADRLRARYVAAAGMVLCVFGLLGLSFLTDATPYWYIIVMVCLVGIGVTFFGIPNTTTIMGSVEMKWVGVASATVATMRQTGTSMSQGLVTLILALVVGQHAIGMGDYPQVLKSVRLSFLIFTVLCVVGMAAMLMARGPEEKGTDVGPAERL